jgi:hypothetical protein
LALSGRKASYSSPKYLSKWELHRLGAELVYLEAEPRVGCGVLQARGGCMPMRSTVHRPGGASHASMPSAFAKRVRSTTFSGSIAGAKVRRGRLLEIALPSEVGLGGPVRHASDGRELELGDAPRLR